MLNGAHSALAYLGLVRGHIFVHQAVDDPAIFAIVRSLMCDEAASTIAPAPGQDPADYANNLLARFRNAALNHRLAQIAIDGSEKVPQRWFATALERERRGLASPALAAAMAAWAHSRGDNGVVVDPKAARLRALWAGVDATAFVQLLTGADNGLFDMPMPAGLAAELLSLTDRH